MKRGDRIEAAIKPFAQFSDEVLRTHLQDCDGCTRSKNNLNAGMSIPAAMVDRVRFEFGRLRTRVVMLPPPKTSQPPD